PARLASSCSSRDSRWRRHARGPSTIEIPMRRLRSSPHFRRFLAGSGIFAGLAALALPAFAEADATRRLENAISRRTDADPDSARARVSLDATGLHLHELRLERGGLEIYVADARVRP